MAETTVTPIRLSEEPHKFFKDAAAKDSRTFAGYLRLVLETVAAKGLTWQEIEKLPAKP